MCKPNGKKQTEIIRILILLIFIDGETSLILIEKDLLHVVDKNLFSVNKSKIHTGNPEQKLLYEFDHHNQTLVTVNGKKLQGIKNQNLFFPF